MNTDTAGNPTTRAAERDHQPPVLIGTVDDGWLGALEELATTAGDLAGDVTGALRLAHELGARCPLPGHQTTVVWSVLATLGAADLTVARVVEPHLDALAIVAQADLAEGSGAADATWGVFAAEGPGEPLKAEPCGHDEWQLTGIKHWCSLADRLDRALVTAVVDDRRGLFDVDLTDPAVDVLPARWAARGLTAITSGPVAFDQVPARPVGAPGWYLSRPGFAWGGMGVAAVWYGAAVALARRIWRGRPGKSRPDQIALSHVGAVDAALTSTGALLAQTAAAVDHGHLSDDRGAVAAYRVRAAVAGTAEDLMRRSVHNLGPAPLALEEESARRMSDLQVYLAQWHAERDAAALGQRLIDTHLEAPW